MFYFIALELAKADVSGERAAAELSPSLVMPTLQFHLQESGRIFPSKHRDAGRGWFEE